MKFRITTWPEGFVVEAPDEERALVQAEKRIAEDAYLLAAVALDTGDLTEVATPKDSRPDREVSL